MFFFDKGIWSSCDSITFELWDLSWLNVDVNAIVISSPDPLEGVVGVGWLSCWNSKASSIIRCWV